MTTATIPAAPTAADLVAARRRLHAIPVPSGTATVEQWVQFYRDRQAAQEDLAALWERAAAQPGLDGLIYGALTDAADRWHEAARESARLADEIAAVA